MRDTLAKFSLATVALHWLIAIAMIAMLAFGLYLEDMASSPDKGALIGLHKSIGILILFFAITRIIWRIQNKFPQPLSKMPNWQAFIAKLTHWVLIVGTVLMPISGVLMSVGGGYSVGVFGWELISGTGEKNEAMSNIGHLLHGLGGKLLILFIVLHAAGAIKHQVIDKDGTLSRMLGKKV